MKRIATADRTHVRRRRGRPWGSTKGLPPRVSMRLKLAPETVQAIEICATASGLSAGAWLDFTIRDFAMGGQLLLDRKEKNLTIKEVRCLVDTFTSLAHAQTIDDIIASAAKSVRRQQPSSSTSNP
jgi:hypothetical protein